MTASIYQSGEYLAKHPTWHAEDAPWKARQVNRMLQRNSMTPSTICEIGCGAGSVIAELQRRDSHGARFWGYEISPQAYELCRSKANDRLRFILGDILEDPPGRPFEVLLLLDVVEHVEDHLGFLRRVKPLGDAKIFHFPLDLSAQSVLRGIPSRVRETAGHLHYFTKELALQTLEDSGYQVLDYFYTPAALENPSPAMRTRLMRLPRRLLFSLSPDGAALLFGGFSLLILAV
jgi:SAM-dependent methyltransferase